MDDFAHWCRDCEKYADTYKTRNSGDHFCRECSTVCVSVPDTRPLRSRIAKLEAEVARLTGELEDVRKLDEWAASHDEQWSTRKEAEAADGEAFVVVLGFDEDGYYCGETPAAARRAAVECLEKEQADG